MWNLLLYEFAFYSPAIFMESHQTRVISYEKQLKKESYHRYKNIGTNLMFDIN